MREIREVTIPDMAVLSVRHEHVRVEQLPGLIGGGFAALAAYAAANGGEIADEPFVAFYGMGKDGHLDETDMSIEIAFPLRAAIAGQGEVECREWPGTDALQVTYKGDYDKGMIEVYERMLGRIEARGDVFLGSSREAYLTGPETPPSEQMTVITMPFRRA
jgi:Transcriptional regulator, effector-binding domain/component